MVERDRADGVEPAQIVSVRRVVAVPGDDVERRVIDLARPEISAKFRDQLHRAFAVFVPGDRRFEIARVGEAVGADRAEVGQAEMLAVVFADVAARLSRQPVRHGISIPAG